MVSRRRVYWLWLTGDDGNRVAAGTFRGQPQDVQVTLTSALPLRDTRRIWVTDEDDAVVLDAQRISASCPLERRAGVEESPAMPHNVPGFDFSDDALKCPRLRLRLLV